MKISKKFLNVFKKNDIVIYAIALMLVTAGYLNYTVNVEDSIETYSEDVSSIAEAESENTTDDSEEDVGEARLVDSDAVIENEDSSEEIEAIDEEENDDSDSSDENAEESGAEEDGTDYFVETKLERDKTYASMISIYTQIMEDNSVSETQKAVAMNEITEINNIKNAISVCENVLSTKGFVNLVVLINDNSVNVVVSVDGGLTTESVAQIQNVVSRELDAEIEDIHITEL